MTNVTTKIKTSFWVISIVALIWNAMGVMAYLGQAYMTEEALALLSEPEQLYQLKVAPWVTAAYATAVFGGLLGCVLLLFRKKIAKLLFIISLIAVCIQATYNFFIQEFMETTLMQIVGSLVILLIAVFLVWYANHTIKKGYIS